MTEPYLETGSDTTVLTLVADELADRIIAAVRQHDDELKSGGAA